jgi:hypothetical protein
MHYNNINAGPLVRETFLFLREKISQNDGSLSIPQEKLLKAYSDSFLTYKEYRDYLDVEFTKSDLAQLGNHLSDEMADDEIYEGLLLFDFDVLQEEEFDASVGSYSPREFEITPVAYCLSEWLPRPNCYDFLWFPIRALDYKHSNKSDIESMKDIANDNYQNYLEDRVSI